jgi:glycosyltransferase involved in cell wall biosynthesis
MRNVKKIAIMAVGDDGWMGGIQYITNILGALDAIAGEAAVEVHLFKHPMQNFSELKKFRNVNIYVHDLESELPAWSFVNRTRWLLQRKWMGRIYPRLENFLLGHRFDYVFPATLSDCGKKLNAGAWIADFQYRHFPDGAGKATTEAADRVISGISHHTQKIVLSSKFCENDCHQFFPITRKKTHVMPFSVFLDKDIFAFEDFASIREKYSLPEKFLIVSNLFAQTKNHKTLFRALGILKEQGTDVNLVCTGNIVDYRNHGYANEILQMLTGNRIRGQVYLLGIIPRADQLSLYRMAVAMVQPSINEGWSTLVEEAKALGKNLLLSDIMVHMEQYPGNPYFFKSLDPANLAEKMLRVWNSGMSGYYPDRAEELKAFGAYQENVKAFGRRFLEIARL